MSTKRLKYQALRPSTSFANEIIFGNLYLCQRFKLFILTFVQNNKYFEAILLHTRGFFGLQRLDNNKAFMIICQDKIWVEILTK